MHIVYVLVIGALAGWLAGQIMRGGGFGLLELTSKGARI